MAEIKVPELAESITEGTIAEWLKSPGDYVEKGENIAELETDKVNVEIPSEESGVIKELLKEPGDTVEVGDVIAVIDQNGEAGGSEESSEESSSKEDSSKEESAKEEPEKEDTKKEEAPAASKEESSEEESDSDSSPSDSPVASPSARKLAREKGLNLDDIPTRDPLGRVRKEDVENYESNTKAAAKSEAPAKESKPKEKESKDEFAGKPVEREKLSAAARLSQTVWLKSSRHQPCLLHLMK